MMNKKLEDALNKQISAEMNSSYLYLAMAAYFESINLPGFANWMEVQAQEEMVHAMKFYKYIFDRSGRVELMSIEKPPLKWNSPLNAFDETLKHEKKITSMINNLALLAIEERDLITHNFMQWFLTEQVEEEKTANSLFEKLRMIESSTDALFIIDKELATRVFTPPATATTTAATKA
ncbi:MAG: ferritin [Oligoflexia bacterium]|nr:ferritin [Oligoflexia bacterium]